MVQGINTREHLIFLAVPVEKVVDTIGARDCFVAAFSYGMLKPEDIAQAIRVANLVASYSISKKKGTSISFPIKSDVNWKQLE
jgi:sugar/nucleoside kinase (ribokinase family)